MTEWIAPAGTPRPPINETPPLPWGVKEYPTADLRRCYDCAVLPGRDHLARCKSPTAKRQRRIKD